VLTSVKRKRNREGKLWAAVQIEDHDGSVDAMVFSTTYEMVADDLDLDTPVLIRGVALPEEGAATRISVKDVVALENARVDLPRLISIRVALGSSTNGNDRPGELNQLFERKRGETEVRLRLESPNDFSVILDVTERVRPDKEFQTEIERICGPSALEVLAD